ncbi:MAG: cysteine--tRNA ligase [Nitrospirae bacterium]|nr:cysteine--tRNA ligase [Nitrospirota bacterium]
MLTIHNTLTGQKEPFKPITPGIVRMYACGVTVYDNCHLGHARSALIFDIIRRYLEFSGLAVTYVRNFTDVDDKIIARAAKEGVTWTEIVGRYLTAYDRDMARIGVNAATVQPKATEHIGDIIALIERLLAKGHAYRVDGDVYFLVESYRSYGRLSKRKAEDLQAGARVEVDERKRNPMDFALWKASKPGEPAWDSPWGSGRPGWHIECSAMSMRHLGDTFDIHGGGMDLIFPHHENEIAQSSAATGKEFAHCWIHNGFVQINQEKMSKSLGNFFAIRDVFERSGCRESVTGEVLRYFLLATHYRGPLDFSDAGLAEAKRALDGLYGLFQRLEEVTTTSGAADPRLREEVTRLDGAFRSAMDDDFNTAEAIAAFQRLRNEVNRLLAAGLSASACREAREAFRSYGRVVGLFQLPASAWEYKELQFRVSGQAAGLGDAPAGLSDHDIEQQVTARNDARCRKDFARADEIRKALAAQGITIEDRPDGTSRWKK